MTARKVPSPYSDFGTTHGPLTASQSLETRDMRPVVADPPPVPSDVTEPTPEPEDAETSNEGTGGERSISTDEVDAIAAANDAMAGNKVPAVGKD